MTIENNEVAVAVEETVKPKRTRKPVVKVTKTGLEIVEHIAALQTEVTELTNELDEINPNSSFRKIAEEVLTSKQAELDALLATVYTI